MSSRILLASVYNVVKGYLAEFEKDKFPGLDPSALMLLSRHFRTHRLHNYLVFGLYGFSSRPFSSRMHFFLSLLNCFDCLHSAMLHGNMCFILDSFRLRFHDGSGSIWQRLKFTLTCFSSFLWYWIFLSLLALLSFILTFNMILPLHCMYLKFSSHFPLIFPINF